jgi:hypothetical protein
VKLSLFALVQYRHRRFKLRGMAAEGIFDNAPSSGVNFSSFDRLSSCAAVRIMRPFFSKRSVLTHFWCNLKDVKCGKPFNSKKFVPNPVYQDTSFQKTPENSPNCPVFNCIARKDSSAVHQK